MKITHDKQLNVAYISLTEKTGPLKTVKAGTDVNIDFLPDGTVFGFELLNAEEQIKQIIFQEAEGAPKELCLT